MEGAGAVCFFEIIIDDKKRIYIRCFAIYLHVNWKTNVRVTCENKETLTTAPLPIPRGIQWMLLIAYVSV